MELTAAGGRMESCPPVSATEWHALTDWCQVVRVEIIAVATAIILPGT